MKTGTAQLPLHGGKAPRYLFDRMVKLGRGISLMIAEEYGPLELMRRLADPFWFQALGCVLGYDWHSSGVTTVVCAALKEAWMPISNETGLYIAGGKGAASRKTPAEIEAFAPQLQVAPSQLIYASRMSAKVDNNALQDGYQIYHHAFVFDRQGRWAVIQQGMNPASGFARRYHWLSESVTDFVDEPHAGIISAGTSQPLNLVAHESDPARQASVVLALEKPWKNLAELKRLQQLELPGFEQPQPENAGVKTAEQTLPGLELPARHAVVLHEDINPDRIASTLTAAYEAQPQNFEQLLGTPNVGPKTIRALALLSEVIHGAKPSFRDPARFSFAHGGKDGHPFPVDRKTYDQSIEVLKTAIERAKVGERDRMEAFKRLNNMILENNQ